MPDTADWTPDEWKSTAELVKVLRLLRAQGGTPVLALILGESSHGDFPTTILGYSGIAKPVPRSYDSTLRQHSQSMEDTDPDLRVPAAATNGETTDTDDAILEVLRTCEKPLKRESIAKRAHRNNNTYFFERLKALRQQGLVRCFPGHLYWLADRGAPAPEEV